MRRRRDERGLSESLQWAVLAPVLMLIVLGLIEAGVWLHGRSIVQQAALTAAETQALSGISSDAAEKVVADMTGQLEAVRTHSLVSDTEISVTVEATVPLPLDVGLGDVTVTATRVKEQ
ncbi:TadE/TadG family type IV pilus assembly protein [Propionibacterium freudenreichii]|uniref:TadE/TadG family type IV pilus assembly protein n=1 Tax=Propionibacterium freudenreichii TaxID=1744 RepID=UPI0021A73D07|nr:TadE/TadG family type IV pilus assembly protein [Propionibacterium freudenreichii]